MLRPWGSRDLRCSALSRALMPRKMRLRFLFKMQWPFLRSRRSRLRFRVRVQTLRFGVLGFRVWL